MNGPWGYNAKWNKSEKDKYHMISPICGILKQNFKTKEKNKEKTKTNHKYRE